MKFGLHTLLIESHFKRLPRFHFDFGWGNGYVLLPYNHPFYGVHYDDISVSIHGGLTFSEYFDVERFSEWIGNREILGDVTRDNFEKFSNYWMIGFDTAHSGDDLESCSREFVLSETNDLLEQCLSDGIDGMKKYKSIYLRKDKLKVLNASVIALSKKV